MTKFSAQLPKKWVKETRRTGIKSALCRMIEKRTRRDGEAIIAEQLVDDTAIHAARDEASRKLFEELRTLKTSARDRIYYDYDCVYYCD